VLCKFRLPHDTHFRQAPRAEENTRVMVRNSRKQPSPAIHRQRTLRVLGTDISLLEAVRLKAISDLGFNIEFEVLDFPNCQRKAALTPEAYDGRHHLVEQLEQS
jgi:hypothetical protein